MTDKQYGSPVTEQAPAPGKRRRRNTVLWILGPALVIIVGAWMYVTAGRYVSTDNAYVQADRATIAPQVAGRVVEVDVRENQAVKKGDVLFRIDPEPLQIAVARAQAQMEGISSLLDAARAGFRSAQANVRSADEALRVNEAQYKRMQELRRKGLVAQKDVDDAANNLADARGKRDSNVAGVAKAQSLLGGLPETPDQELSGYKLAKAQLAAAELDLDHATVRAPIDGTIGRQNLQPGDFLAPGQAAMPLVATRGLWIDANFKETDLTNVRVGQPVSIEVDTYPGKAWKGHVASISPASGSEFSVLPAQNATGNWVKIVQRIAVRIAVDDESAGPTLRAGMSAVVKIDTGKQNSLLGRIEGARAEPQTRAATAAH
ncbi:MAG: HlyD family secretion protein [Proteobacteria bacterium]|jgi:membrane fusion protein (multidrug efflux system)|nr:HlyD family secretion protein [Pseudomonadota bacterium]HMM57731.1 HlyD family secretion protein [Rudaea sp.]